MHSNRGAVLALTVAILSVLTASPTAGQAQSRYPERPIRLVVPFPPGGVNDAVGRPWAEKMRPLLGPVVVENMGGAGGVIGTAAVARAQPDGYTILFANAGSFVIPPIASSRPPYDPVKDFAPVAVLVLSTFAIAVHPALPPRTLPELLEYAKADKGALSYGSAGVGSGNHLTGELFKSLAGLPHIVHVPYRGAGPAITDLVSGQIPMATPVVTSQVLDLHRSGKLRVLAVTASRRLSAAPEIPTAVEAGLPDMVSEGFHGLFAPAGTPSTIIDQIATATHAVMAEQEFQRFLIASGLEPQLDSGPETTRRMLFDDISRWRPIIKAIGLKLD